MLTIIRFTKNKRTIVHIKLFSFLGSSRQTADIHLLFVNLHRDGRVWINSRNPAHFVSTALCFVSPDLFVRYLHLILLLKRLTSHLLTSCSYTREVEGDWLGDRVGLAEAVRLGFGSGDGDWAASEFGDFRGECNVGGDGGTLFVREGESVRDSGS